MFPVDPEYDYNTAMLRFGDLQCAWSIRRAGVRRSLQQSSSLESPEQVDFQSELLGGRDHYGDSRPAPSFSQALRSTLPMTEASKEESHELSVLILLEVNCTNYMGSHAMCSVSHSGAALQHVTARFIQYTRSFRAATIPHNSRVLSKSHFKQQIAELQEVVIGIHQSGIIRPTGSILIIVDCRIHQDGLPTNRRKDRAVIVYLHRSRIGERKVDSLRDDLHCLGIVWRLTMQGLME